MNSRVVWVGVCRIVIGWWTSILRIDLLSLPIGFTWLAKCKISYTSLASDKYYAHILSRNSPAPARQKEDTLLARINNLEDIFLSAFVIFSQNWIVSRFRWPGMGNHPPLSSIAVTHYSYALTLKEVAIGRQTKRSIYCFQINLIRNAAFNRLNTCDRPDRQQSCLGWCMQNCHRLED